MKLGIVMLTVGLNLLYPSKDKSRRDVPHGSR